jgi:NAD+ diphosphatase
MGTAPMRDAETVTFGGGGLDRAEDLRRDAAALAALPPRTLPLWRGKPLLAPGRDAVRLLDGHAWPDHGHPILLGRLDGRAVFARDVSGLEVGEPADSVGAFRDASEQTRPDLPSGCAFADLRANMTRLAPLDAELAATARGMTEWHRTHGHCANCGAPTLPGKAGWQRGCPGCGRVHFPRTDAVVIMLITRGDRVLLGRSHGWPQGFYSLLAGFMEPGETLEAAVRREVFEETGVTVGPVSYLASQPWPFPASLMLGARGRATSDEIDLDADELDDALWLTRAEAMRAQAGLHPSVTGARPGAIARFLLDRWLADDLD